MARLRSGILGNIRGKVSGVVGAQWKDKNYLREYVKPANPNTAAQQTQRTKMSDCVEFAKPLVGPIFNSYTDKFQKSMSGFNYFIKQNIAEFDGDVDYSALKLSEGKLHPPGTVVGTYDGPGEELIIAFDATIGNNGSVDDKVFVCAYNKDTGIWYFAGAEADRDGAQKVLTVPDSLTATDFQCYALAAQYSGTLVSLISDSVHDVAAAI